jgi:hypothetical protein
MSIDLNASEPLLQFRKCFDEMILPPSKLNESEIEEITNSQKTKRKRNA